MSRIGPYASLLIALILLLMAEVPRLVPGLLLMVGMAPARISALASSVGIGLVLIAAGFIVLSLVWLLRISRIEAAWLPFRDAMVGVAAPLGRVVEVDYPRGMEFRADVGGHDVRVYLDPGDNGRLSFVTAMTPRQTFVVLRRGVELTGMAGQWRIAGEGKSWELRSPRPTAVEWIARDLELARLLDRFFGDWKLRMMAVVPAGAEVTADVQPPTEIGQTIMRGFETIAALARLNDMSSPKKKSPPIW